MATTVETALGLTADQPNTGIGAIEVGNIDEALEWYRRIFDFSLRGKG